MFLIFKDQNQGKQKRKENQKTVIVKLKKNALILFRQVQLNATL